MILEACIVYGTLFYGVDLIYKACILPSSRKAVITPRKFVEKQHTVKKIANNSSTLPMTIVSTENSLDRNLLLSSVSVLSAAIGRLYYPPLLPFSLLGLILPLYESAKCAYNDLAEKRRLNQHALEVIVIPGIVLAGYYFTACLSYWLYHLSQKLLQDFEDRTSSNLVGLFENQPGTVWIVRDTVEVAIPFDSLQINNIVSLKAGETIPADGVIVGGYGMVDQHLLTGEAQPVEKKAGDPVLASTRLLAGCIRFRVSKSGKETIAAKIVEMLHQTIAYKPSVQTTGEILSEHAAMPTLLIGAAALPISGYIGFLAVISSYVAWDIRVLAPLGMVSFLTVATQNGILVKNARSLELLNHVDLVVFDKTGTLTDEQPHVSHIYAYGQYSQFEILKYAAIAEQRQSHPIARAILSKAEQADVRLPEIDDSVYTIGYGIQVVIDGVCILAGSKRFMELEGIEISHSVLEQQSECHEDGSAQVMIAVGGVLAGVIELNETIRPEAPKIIASLRNMGKKVIIISGDHERPTRKLAEKLGVDTFYAEILPAGKAEIIDTLQQAGSSVCFVGDGINDAIAMQKAHVSISLSGASAAAKDTANIILMDGTLQHLSKLHVLSDDFKRNMNMALILSIVPSAINIGGVFLFHTGLYFAIFMDYLALPIGLGNALLPLIKNKGKDRNLVFACADANARNERLST